ncbi:MAG: hypothetical protein MUE73_17030 [Planctomycetes bacterium]|nr:hypothetical protein [Planctomycetota bacterium]
MYGALFGRREVRRHAAALAATMVLLSLGGYLPLFPAVHEYLPGFSLFRSHGRFLLPAALFLALLAAAGTDAWLRGDGRGRRVSILSMLALAAALAGAGAAARSADLYRRFLGLIAVPGENFSAAVLSEPEVVARTSRASSASLLLAAGTAAAVALLLLGRGRTKGLAYGLFVLAVLEPFAFSRFADRPVFEHQHPSLAGLPEFLSTLPRDVRTLNPVLPDVAMSAGSHEIWGYDSFVNRRWVELVYFLMGRDPDEAAHFQSETFAESHRLLAMLRCGYILSPGPGGVRVLRSTRKPMPRFHLVGSFRVASGRDAVFAALGDPAFDPFREVVLESEPAIRLSGADRDLGIVRASDESTDGVTIEAFMAEPALLLVTDQWSRHWKAEPLGPSPQSSYDVMPANHALRAIPLAAGRHRFRMEYRPPLFDASRWISLTSLAACGLLAAASWRRRK